MRKYQAKTIAIHRKIHTESYFRREYSHLNQYLDDVSQVANLLART